MPAPNRATRSGSRIIPVVAALTCVALASLTPGAHAESKIDPAAYPELALDRLLPPIMANLKQNLPDPYSIRDLTVCPASVIRLRDGKPFSWSVEFAMNSKGESGGYTGFSYYVIGFRDGVPDAHLVPNNLGKQGLDGQIRASVIKKFSACTPIPDATVQALLIRPIGTAK